MKEQIIKLDNPCDIEFLNTNFSYLVKKPYEFDVSAYHQKTYNWFSYKEIPENWEIILVMLEPQEAITHQKAYNYIEKKKGKSLSRDNLFLLNLFSKNFRYIINAEINKSTIVEFHAPIKKGNGINHLNLNEEIYPVLRIGYKYDWGKVTSKLAEIRNFLYFKIK